MPVLDGYKKWNRKIEGTKDVKPLFLLPDDVSLPDLLSFVDSYLAGAGSEVWSSALSSAFSWARYEQRKDVDLSPDFFSSIHESEAGTLSQEKMDTLHKVVLDWKKILNTLGPIQKVDNPITTLRRSLESAEGVTLGAGGEDNDSIL